MSSKKYKPTKDRLLVFTMPVRRKHENSILYTPAPRRGSMSKAGECWIVECGKDVTTVFKRGQKVYTMDGFEFEPVPLPHLWEQVMNEDCFKSLKDLQDALDGDVHVNILTERQILAVED